MVIEAVRSRLRLHGTRWLDETNNRTPQQPLGVGFFIVWTPNSFLSPLLIHNFFSSGKYSELSLVCRHNSYEC